MKKFCWVVGNGNSIGVWKDKWIPGLSNFTLLSDPSWEDFEDMKVSDLIIDGKWDLGDLDGWLAPSEIQAIYEIPIPKSFCEDKLLWTGNHNEIYTVKSEYKVMKV